MSVRYGEASGNWVIATTVLGSGVAFLDSTVVNVALPTIERNLHTGIAGLQWTVDGYLLTLGSLILVGGSLGDLFGRRKMFVTGLAIFAVSSLACALAPNIGVLIGARALQGIGGALLVPQSLAIIGGCFEGAGQTKAVAAWSGLSGVTTLFGPALGGWLVTISWRWIFIINLPLTAIAIAMALAKVPESMDPHSARKLDIPGSIAGAAALGGIVYMLIEGPGRGFAHGSILTAGILGGILLVAFVVIERVTKNPMIPATLFRSKQFTGANLTTALVYFSLYGVSFLVVIQLQSRLGYSPLEAGFATVPITVLLLVLSPQAGKLSMRVGPRIPMTVGPSVIAVGLYMMGGIRPGDTYMTGVLPGVIVFGLGLSLTVAPLTAAMLAAVEQRHMGVGSAVNNMISRVGGLLAIAMLPFLGGVRGGSTPTNGQYGRGLIISAGFCLAGGAIAFATIRRAAPPERQGTETAVVS
ncbi:MAG: DHA2 family efflux MFS transporter permease subunit [Actinomycetota bacterium]